MRVELPTRNITITGAHRRINYYVAPTQRVMDMLSRQYSDPKAAVVREYLANMADAHRALLRAGGTPPRPAELHVPTMLEPWLSFIDYGIGMDAATMERVYVGYNASTKGESDDDIGGFGIGAKAAFAYPKADTWTVETRYNGVITVYAITKDSRGEAAAYEMGASPTSEPTGVTVTIPVMPEDVEAFRKACQRFVRYFEMPLTISGDTTVVATPPKYAMQSATWGVRADRSETRWQVVMGGVPYWLDTYQLAQAADLEVSALLALPADLYLPIGAVDIPPSREVVEYNDRTAAALRAAVHHMLEELPQQAQALIDAAGTEWEAVTLVHERFNHASLRKYFRSVEWRGHQIDAVRGVYRELADLEVALPQLELKVLRQDSSRPVWLDPEDLYVSPADERVYVVLDDLPRRRGRARLRYWLKQRLQRGSGRHTTWKTGKVYVFSPKPEAPATDAAQLSEALGGLPVLLTSEMPEPPKPTPRSTQGRQRFAVKHMYTPDSHTVYMEGTVLDLAELPELAPVYYERLRKNELVGTAFSHRTCAKLFAAAKRLGLIDGSAKLYLLPGNAKSLERLPEFVHFSTWAHTELGALVRQAARDVAVRNALAPLASSAVAKWLLRLSPEQQAVLPAAVRRLLPLLAEHARASVARADLREPIEALRGELEQVRVRVPKRLDGHRALNRVMQRYPALALLHEAGTVSEPVATAMRRLFRLPM